MMQCDPLSFLDRQAFHRWFIAFGFALEFALVAAPYLVMDEGFGPFTPVNDEFCAFALGGKEFAASSMESFILETLPTTLSIADEDLVAFVPDNEEDDGDVVTLTTEDKYCIAFVSEDKEVRVFRLEDEDSVAYELFILEALPTTPSIANKDLVEDDDDFVVFRVEVFMEALLTGRSIAAEDVVFIVVQEDFVAGFVDD